MNLALRNLIVAIVGSVVDGSHIRRPTLLDHFQTIQLISKFYLTTSISQFLFILYSLNIATRRNTLTLSALKHTLLVIFSNIYELK
jgi:hypothetical protein